MGKQKYKRYAFWGVSLLCIGLLMGCGKTAEPISVESKEAESNLPQTGETVMFGSYQGEEIAWKVLDTKGNKALLFSEYGLDAQPFDEQQRTGVLWENSSLRTWLNEDFYQSAFSEKEKAKIILSKSEGFPENNVADANGNGYIFLERETEDKVFLLSYTEICEYLSEDHHGVYDDQMSHSELLCYPTDYAKQNTDLLIDDACGWWLCNTVLTDRESGTSVQAISAYGALTTEMVLTSGDYAVRPAIWVVWDDEMGDAN